MIIRVSLLFLALSGSAAAETDFTRNLREHLDTVESVETYTVSSLADYVRETQKLEGQLRFLLDGIRESSLPEGSERYDTRFRSLVAELERILELLNVDSFRKKTKFRWQLLSLVDYFSDRFFERYNESVGGVIHNLTMLGYDVEASERRHRRENCRPAVSGDSPPTADPEQSE